MIKTEIWEPNPDKPGFIRYVKQVKLGKISQDIKHTLDKIIMDDDPDRTALSHLYWISAGGYIAPAQAFQQDWPKKTNPQVTVRRGNEGYLIEILARDRKGTAKIVFTLKMEGTNHAETWTIAQALDAAFED